MCEPQFRCAGALACNPHSLSVTSRAKGVNFMTRRIPSIYSALTNAFPAPEPGLKSKSCFQLLISVILSAQTTDAQVNQVTRPLFSRYPDAEALASAKQAEIERLIYSTGFYRMKAKNIINAARFLIDRYSGTIPSTIEELIKIPGVGRKSANVIVGRCFGKPAIIVDTHFSRVVRRLGITDEKDPVKIEMALKAMVPEKEQYRFSMLVYLHGQSVCTARKPDCISCAIQAYCRYFSGGK
jgi:endonuclease-3